MAIDPKRFGLAVGILWSLSMFLTTLISVWTGYARTMLDIMASIYPGYSITLSGSVIGLIFGFIDGFITGYILIWIYNWLENKM